MSREFDGRKRVIIEAVTPEIDGGRFPAKRVVGDIVRIGADIFTDGHDLISAVVLHRHQSEEAWREVRLRALVNDQWETEIAVGELGFHHFTVAAWIDHFLTWHRDMKKRVDAKVSEEELAVQLQIGLAHIRAAAERAGARDKAKLEAIATTLAGEETLAERISDLWSEDLLTLMWRNAERKYVTQYERELAIEVDRPLAAFGAWYELFPRSAAKEAGKHGTLRDVEAQLPRVAKMGFDILYLPPIHPIGVTFRKGKNNKVTAEPGDVGSPWAIGGKEGGHTAIHPDLGTMEDFEHLVAAAASHKIELALDIAFQVSPDHPYVKEHPDWFLHRPDGTIQYAENPPKKYQDIYPFHFESAQWQELWRELRDVFRFWIGKGIRVFRVDNPHTKPLPFWEWCIREIKREYPDVIFLAEAFTRPRIMYRLAKGGFTQSYTYFAWRNTTHELEEYFTEVTKPPVSDFFRPNAWPNTPDILTEYLQFGGRNAFTIRFVLAATLAATYGIYGPAFERFVNDPRDPGGEEYLDSEKYEIHHWPPVDDDLSDFIAVVNKIRRDNESLHTNETLTFHKSNNPQVICYSKTAGENAIICAVNVDPHNVQTAEITLDLEALKIDDSRAFQVHDLLSGARHSWQGPRAQVTLNPHIVPAQIFRIRRRVRTEKDFEYFL